MDILNNKYLPLEDVKNIIKHLPPKDILNFCNVNKFTRKICVNIIFWINYIGNNQYKYDDLIYEIAKEGNLKLIIQLWTHIPTVISQPITLLCWRDALLDGHEQMAEYLYALYYIWETKLMKGTSDEVNFETKIRLTYQGWSNNEVNFTIKNIAFINSFKKAKFQLLLKGALEHENYDYAVKLLERWTDDRRSILSTFGYAKSLSILEMIIKMAEDLGYDINEREIPGIFRESLFKSDLRLSEELLNKYPGLQSFHYIINIYNNNYNTAVDFIEKHVAIWIVNSHSGPISNRNVLYYILNRIDDNEVLNCLLASYKALDTYDYVNMIKKHISCIDLQYQEQTINILVNSGYYYTAKVFIEEIPVCA